MQTKRGYQVAVGYGGGNPLWYGYGGRIFYEIIEIIEQNPNISFIIIFDLPFSFNSIFNYNISSILTKECILSTLQTNYRLTHNIEYEITLPHTIKNKFTIENTSNIVYNIDKVINIKSFVIDKLSDEYNISKITNNYEIYSNINMKFSFAKTDIRGVGY